MGVDPQTAQNVPFPTVMRDIEMMGLENKWGPNSITHDDMESSGQSPGIIRQVVGQ